MTQNNNRTDEECQWPGCRRPPDVSLNVDGDTVVTCEMHAIATGVQFEGSIQINQIE